MEAETAAVADDGSVDLVIPARRHTDNAVADAFIRMEINGAAARTGHADIRLRVEIPCAALETEIRSRERADGAKVHGIALIIVLPFVPDKGIEFHMTTAVYTKIRCILGHVLEKRLAASAVYAAVLIADDAVGYAFLLRAALVERKARLAGAVGVSVILQGAFTGFIADGTVEGVIDEIHFHEHAAERAHLAALHVEHMHAFADGRVAGGLEFRRPFYRLAVRILYSAPELDKAHAAVARYRERRMKADMRYMMLFCFVHGVKQVLRFVYPERLAVDDDVDHGGDFTMNNRCVNRAGREKNCVRLRTRMIRDILHRHRRSGETGRHVRLKI